MVLMTGEGLRRLMKVVRRIGVEEAFVASLGKARKFARGPKPGQGAARNRAGAADRRRKSRPPKASPRCCRASISKAIASACSFIPDKDHSVLIGAIKAQGAEVDTVLPYAYDAQAADANIITAIDEMAAGRIDAIALTNLGQVRRLIEVARARGCEDTSTQGVRAHADRFRRTGGIGRTQVPRPAHRHLSGRGRLLHAAADIGDGGGARKKSAALGCAN